MAIDTLGGALRQINRLFAEGSVTGLCDAQLLETPTAFSATSSSKSLARSATWATSRSRSCPATSNKRR
jgi:hypothetical protein